MARRPSQPTARHRRPASGFTLVELMISIALVVILILGVNTVFQSTTAAVGAGQALSSAVRDGRAAQTTFLGDLSGAASDGAFFIIHSGQSYGFRNRADLAADKDQDASTATITAPDDTPVYATTYNNRNHRQDVLTFFSRGNFPAQTGDTSYVYPVDAPEARVWYGLLKLPNGTYYDPSDTANYALDNSTIKVPSFQFPGFSAIAPTNSVPNSNVAVPGAGVTAANPTNNPNNFFASDWVLGRVATLLLPLSSTSVPPTMPTSVTKYYSFNSANRSMWPPSPFTAKSTVSLAPLWDAATVADTVNSAFLWYQSYSRFDVAQTSISNFSQQLSDYITNSTVNGGTNNFDWYDNFGMGRLGTYPIAGGSDPRELFQCNPFVTTAQTSTTTKQERVSRTSPYFLKGCTQFTVEFAGDFVKQDDDPNSPTYGSVEDIVTTNNGNADGIDFVVDPTTHARKVRWYGLPRNTSGTIAIPGDPTATNFVRGTATAPPTNALNSNALNQVMPLRDFIESNTTYEVYNSSGANAGTYTNSTAGNQAPANLQTALNAPVTSGSLPQWIERSVPKASSDYSGTTSGSTAMPNGQDYLVAWGPDSDAAGIPRPKMIRITITLDDPNGRLADGQTFQFVYTLP